MHDAKAKTIARNAFITVAPFSTLSTVLRFPAHAFRKSQFPESSAFVSAGAPLFLCTAANSILRTS
jgi:hypothetical protein